MSEGYKAQGNQPPNLKGDFTPRQQIHYDARLHFQELVKFLPPTCMGCRAVRAFEILPLSYKVARGDTAILGATQEVQRYTEGCTGPAEKPGVYDSIPICPSVEKANEQPKCW